MITEISFHNISNSGDYIEKCVDITYTTTYNVDGLNGIKNVSFHYQQNWDISIYDNIYSL